MNRSEPSGETIDPDTGDTMLTKMIYGKMEKGVRRFRVVN